MIKPRPFLLRALEKHPIVNAYTSLAAPFEESTMPESENTHGPIVQIFNSIPDEILMVGNDMVIQEANDSFLRNNNLTIDQVRGSHCYEVEQHIRGKCRMEVEDCPFFKVMER